MAAIRQKAADKAAAIVQEAEDARTKALAEIEEKAAAKRAAVRSDAQAEAAVLLTNGRILSELDAKKETLIRVQAEADRIYQAAASKICGMADDKYRTFMRELVVKNAEDGDAVMVAAPDKKRLDAAWLADAAKRAGKRLTLCRETHDGQGGVLLVGGVYDKDLRIEELVAAARRETEPAVMAMLFNRSTEPQDKPKKSAGKGKK